jgi:myo-inositol-hexaphosphate 3-phosphohydrolase
MRLLSVSLVLVVAMPHFVEAQTVVSVAPTVETDPVVGGGDAADDVAIWRNPSNPGLSVVIGSDKRSGLAVYDLEGNQLQFLRDGKMNNVDLRNGFSLDGERVDLVAATNQSDDTIALYRLDPATRSLSPVSSIATGLDVYGTCMYVSPLTGSFFVFVDSRAGLVEQWELIDAGTGSIGGALVRSFSVGSETEGCVADDETADLYIAEEAVGIWKYGAEPGDGATRSLVDGTVPGGNLTADVEGLTLYYGSDGVGYLIADRVEPGEQHVRLVRARGDQRARRDVSDRGRKRNRRDLGHRRHRRDPGCAGRSLPAGSLRRSRRTERRRPPELQAGALANDRRRLLSAPAHRHRRQRHAPPSTERSRPVAARRAPGGSDRPGDLAALKPLDRSRAPKKEPASERTRRRANRKPIESQSTRAYRIGTTASTPQPAERRLIRFPR